MAGKNPIKSKKHYFQTTLASVANGAVVNITVADAIEGAANSPQHVAEGSVLKAVYFEYWLQNAATVLGSFTAGVYKNPGNGASLTTGEAAALHDWTNKKNLLYTTQGIAPATDSNAPLNVIKGWVKIPKGKQRMGLNDRIVFFIRNNNGTDDINYCGFSTYKSYA